MKLEGIFSGIEDGCLVLHDGERIRLPAYLDFEFVSKIIGFNPNDYYRLWNRGHLQIHGLLFFVGDSKERVLASLAHLAKQHAYFEERTVSTT